MQLRTCTSQQTANSELRAHPLCLSMWLIKRKQPMISHGVGDLGVCPAGAPDVGFPVAGRGYTGPDCRLTVAAVGWQAQQRIGAMWLLRSLVW